MKKSKWTPTDDQLPGIDQRVIAKYSGVYTNRSCTFWRDAGGNAHFGLVNEPDGRGSQPATHWRSID